MPQRRQRLMVANWKMYKTEAETSAWVRRLGELLASAPPGPVVVVVAPAFPCLPAAAAAAQGLGIEVGAQNLHWAPEGAYTGEVSAAMLTAAGCRFVIVGHSERRRLFHETDADVARKLAAALAAGLRPIVCVGETAEERQRGETESVLRRQCESGLADVGAAAGRDACVLAYEPVWAIGTGNTATPAIAQEAHHFLRSCLAALWGVETAARTPILYGGSVIAANVSALMACPDIDGGLVGGASLDAAVFAQLVQRAI